jgi:hypothetical protein
VPTLAILLFAQTAKSLCPFSAALAVRAMAVLTVGISQPSQHSMLMIYEPSHGKIRWIWVTSFYIDGCPTVLIVALKEAIFKWEKGWGPLV